MLGGVSGSSRRALRFFALLAALAIPVACDLNPQPEVPSSTATGGNSGGGGVGGSTGVGGGTTGGSGGIGIGGSGGTNPLPDAGITPCGCPTGQVCYAGGCIDDPCEPNTCDAKQACKPDPDFLASSCLDTCAGVSCASGQVCVDGKCETGCSAACVSGEVCASGADGGYECVPDACVGDAGVTCDAGQVCEPASGACMTDPCTGVKCPVGQSCVDGQCYFDSDAGVDAGDAADD
jgi:hypothetical protein